MGLGPSTSTPKATLKVIPDTTLDLVGIYDPCGDDSRLTGNRI